MNDETRENAETIENENERTTWDLGRRLWHVTANEAGADATRHPPPTPTRTPRPMRFACDHD